MIYGWNRYAWGDCQKMFGHDVWTAWMTQIKSVLESAEYKRWKGEIFGHQKLNESFAAFFLRPRNLNWSLTIFIHCYNNQQGAHIKTKLKKKQSVPWVRIELCSESIMR